MLTNYKTLVSLARKFEVLSSDEDPYRYVDRNESFLKGERPKKTTARPPRSRSESNLQTTQQAETKRNQNVIEEKLDFKKLRQHWSSKSKEVSPPKAPVQYTLKQGELPPEGRYYPPIADRPRVPLKVPVYPARKDVSQTDDDTVVLRRPGGILETSSNRRPRSLPDYSKLQHELPDQDDPTEPYMDLDSLVLKNTEPVQHKKRMSVEREEGIRKEISEASPVPAPEYEYAESSSPFDPRDTHVYDNLQPIADKHRSPFTEGSKTVRKTSSRTENYQQMKEETRKYNQQQVTRNSKFGPVPYKKSDTHEYDFSGDRHTKTREELSKSLAALDEKLKKVQSFDRNEISKEAPKFTPSLGESDRKKRLQVIEDASSAAKPKPKDTSRDFESMNKDRVPNREGTDSGDESPPSKRCGEQGDGV
ncbi:hypothetical protein Ciccas_001005 [Cichlidogyrus casuarinus]|uniref:Uncharacterized protein n=1 Tax=Cichlidogyrus casuarinus TaxID=1844966 RepID=A0ABD2QL96_9PLAT